MNTDVITLSTRFLLEIKEFEKDATGKIKCESDYKKSIVNDIGEVLAGGSVTAAQFNQLIDKEKDSPQKQMLYKPSNILEKHDITYVRKSHYDPENLLTLGQFYYHPRLQVVPPPPMLNIQDDGTISSSYEEEPFFLEIVDRVTVQDLLDYFYLKANIAPQDAVKARDIGAFEHLLKFWDVDFILYLIDEAIAVSLDSGKPLPKKPLDIQHYEHEALVVYEARKNTCFEGGLDRVYPRTIA